MNKISHLIKEVKAGSIAEEMGVCPGDSVLEINGQEIEDVFDYEYLANDEYLELLLQKADGEEWLLEIDKDYDEDLGIVFESSLMSEYKSCRNKCVFCFIDQMPPGMRDTLYFKDDDSRLSFLQGNYVTLTNMSDRDIDRIIRYHLSPINISVHTTNPQLRCQMLNNRFAGEALKKIDRLAEAEVPMNGQIVLCRGINDGEELERTIADLSRYLPYMESVSVVPVGLSKFREGLAPLEPLTKEDAIAAIDVIERWQKKLYPQYGLHFIHASDEFYILAGRELPEEERYDGYLQLENGVGMLRLLKNEVCQALEELEGDEREREISIATGLLAAPFLESYGKQIREKFPRVTIHIYPIVNHFFGESITVAGLVTGSDLKEQLAGRKLGEMLLLPSCMFRSGEEVFLDDVSREDLQNALQVPVNIVKSSGQDLVKAILGLDERIDDIPEYQGYELKEI